MKKFLLPHYYKRIAISTILLAIIFWSITAANPDFLNVQSYILAWVFKMVILLSLLTYVLSKEKIETERIAQLRITNIINAMIGGVFFLVLDTFVEILYAGENFEMASGYHLMVLVLLYYSAIFYIKKNIKTVVRA